MLDPAPDLTFGYVGNYGSKYLEVICWDKDNVGHYFYLFTY